MERIRLEIKVLLRLWWLWLPPLLAFSGLARWLRAEGDLWLTDPLLALAVSAAGAALVFTLCFAIHWGWGD